MLDRDDTVKFGKWTNTPNRRGSGYGFYSSSGLNRKYGNHCYHPYKRSERAYLVDEFKKAKPPPRFNYGSVVGN